MRRRRVRLVCKVGRYTGALFRKSTSNVRQPPDKSDACQDLTCSSERKKAAERFPNVVDENMRVVRTADVRGVGATGETVFAAQFENVHGSLRAERIRRRLRR